MENYYTINQVATMTGLTARTIRNYLKSGLISGEKINGIWMFSAEEFCEMLSNAVIYDFIADDRKKVNKICTVLDLCAEDNEAEEISQFFCNTINSYPDAGDFSFKFEKHGRNVRVILTGTEETVMEILNRYYNS